MSTISPENPLGEDKQAGPEARESDDKKAQREAIDRENKIYFRDRYGCLPDKPYEKTL